MGKEYLCIPASIMDKDELQGYLIAQWFVCKFKSHKAYICSESLRMTFGLNDHRAKKLMNILRERFGEHKEGVVVGKEDFAMEEQFWMIGDREFDLLIGDPALLLHYATLLKSSGQRGRCIYSLEMFAEIEDKTPHSIVTYNKQLVKMGLLEVRHRMNNSNIYILTKLNI